MAFVATAATDSAPPPLDEYEKQRGGVDLRTMRWLDGLQVPRVTRAMGTRASNSARTSRFQRWWERRQRARRRAAMSLSMALRGANHGGSSAGMVIVGAGSTAGCC